ncbi:hypothetical protein FC15_GL000296 [Lapidilactobacillus concavus DSM 17758]|uniref:Oligosaccharide repeat unit polymerase n=1 Tax=Lapidilactobacillus concavus DSM 17758 TaxID=1423735 RepID=A0A0R1VSZ1_9LACO|nr:oligosaccharide repeat unit polymerase [Lapidilactobacillus concavus]KRM08690.1 hypothetical protein FC15_GL000296 [Lapidilactobacillus concavus DSM 17758]GEL13682.1 hypothetical protein LCO01nite_12310 [Lapidilactobacillus concavus]
MINPWTLFSLTFASALFSYSLGWSSSYQDVNSNLVLFLVIAIILFFVMGFIFSSLKNPSAFVEKREIIFRDYLAHFFIFGGIILEGVYSKGFPLTGYIGGHVITYADYGIPMFHVALITVSCFYAVLNVNDYFEGQKTWQQAIQNIVIAFIPTILTYNRGMIMMTGMTMIFLYIRKTKFKFTPIKILSFGILGVAFLFLFGISGNYRINQNYGRPDLNMFQSDIILNQGNATKEFSESSVPKTFFWTYIYAASPLGNLANMVDKEKNLNNSESSIADFVVTQMIPDTIGKRLIDSNKSPIIPLVLPQFNVSTAFSGSFYYFGWIGMIVFLVFVFMFPFGYLMLIRSFALEYYDVAFSSLCTVYSLLFFGNFFSFTGLMLQLIFPFLLQLFRPDKLPQEI